MKVGDGKQQQQARGAEAAKKGQPANKNEASRDGEKRSFSDLIKNRGARSEERVGDERGRRLRDGELQKMEREAGGDHQGRAMEGGACGEADRGGGRAREGRNAEELDNRQSLEALDLKGQAQQVGQMAGTQQAAAMQASSSPAMAEIVKKIVQAVRVGDDAQARRVVFLDVTVPGRGEVRIRLRRDGGGMEVRMRADNDALARTLQEGVAALREEGAKKGVQFTSVQVAR